MVRLNIQLTKNVAFTGGEPTTYPGILEVAKCAKQYSPNVSMGRWGILTYI